MEAAFILTATIKRCLFVRLAFELFIPLCLCVSLVNNP
jgi:hypothetical protein